MNDLSGKVPVIHDIPIGLESSGARLEFDSMGTVEVPANRYWGAQTQRSLEHFSIGNDRMPKAVYHAYGVVEKAAALVNQAAGRLPAWKATVVQIFPPDAVSRRGVSWTGMAGEIVQANRRGRINFHFRAPVHMLAMYERSVRYEGRTLIQGLPQSTLRDCSRKLVFVPAGHEYHDCHEPRTLPRVAFFYFNAARLASSPELGSSGISMSFAPQLFFEDSTLWDTALKLKTLIENDESDNRLYLEALGTVLAHELVRWNMGGRCAEAQVHGGLQGWQRRIAVDYIEEHLVEPISLAELAQLVRLSPNYFCRAFSQSFGMPLHRYHSRQRIERAKTLLAKAGSSVTDVGLTVGYSEASAFSTAFRRVTGLAPSAYRRTLR
jgi:AraC family transcriptional regulator